MSGAEHADGAERVAPRDPVVPPVHDVRGAPVPRPAPGPLEAPFWAAVRTGVLHLQRCGGCGAFQHPPKPGCARCGATDMAWVPSTGRGELWSYTVVHPPVLPAFADRVPYVAAVVRLHEGVFLVTNLVDVALDRIAVGDSVELVVHRVDDELSLPLFRVVQRSTS